MKRTRYSPAATPGHQRPLSKNALQRRYAQASQVASALAAQTAVLARKLQIKEAEAQNANLKLRRLFRTSAERVEFGRNTVRASIDIDAGMPYRDVSGLLTEVVVGLVTKILRTAPELHIGPTKDLLTRVRSLPTHARDEALYRLYHHASATHPHHIDFHAFSHLLTCAAEHAHLLEPNLRENAPWPSHH